MRHSADTPPADDATRLAYLAHSHPSTPWSYQTIRRNGPTEMLAKLPPDEARRRRAAAARRLEQAHELGARTIVPGDQEWPHQLEDLNTDPTGGAPLCLWATGPALLHTILPRSILVTGARAATPYGAHTATRIGYELATSPHGWTIANGGHFGIDTAALHGASLAIDRRPALAMVACGIDRPHSYQNAALFSPINETGVLLSAYPPATPPTTATRTRTLDILAALTTATVIVEALDHPTGLLPAARRAARLPRPVMAVPGPANSLHSAGTHRLIQDGTARLVAHAADIAATLHHHT